LRFLPFPGVRRRIAAAVRRGVPNPGWGRENAAHDGDEGTPWRRPGCFRFRSRAGSHYRAEATRLRSQLRNGSHSLTLAATERKPLAYARSYRAEASPVSTRGSHSAFRQNGSHSLTLAATGCPKNPARTDEQISMRQ
jgi:hypothetical protein